VYSPVAFGAKTDKEGQYIKKYLPQLRRFPAKYIYEPWNAPKSVQEAAGCIIGKDYPLPIVDHADVSKVNMGKMKAAYDANKEAVGTKADKNAGRGDRGAASLGSGSKKRYVCGHKGVEVGKAEALLILLWLLMRLSQGKPTNNY